MCSTVAVTLDQSKVLDSRTVVAINGKIRDEFLDENREYNNGREDDHSVSEEYHERNSSKISGNSPRYEAFVMTGEKILRLNPKISPSYAKLKQSELPSHVQVCSSTPAHGPFSDLENNFHYHNANYLKAKSKISNGHDSGKSVDFDKSVENGDEFRCKLSTSLSEIATKTEQTNDRRFIEDDDNVFSFDKNASLITVQGDFSLERSTSTNAAIHIRSLRVSDDFGSGLFEISTSVNPVFISEPSTPAKFAFDSKQNEASKPLDVKLASKSLSNFDEIVPEEPKARKTFTEQNVNFSAELPKQKQISSVVGISNVTISSVSSSLSSTPIKEKLLHLDSSFPQPHSALTEKDKEAAKRLAKRLHALDGFKKSDIARNLSKNNMFGNLVALEYLNLFDFHGLKLDEAIRKLLSHFCLTGETSERERILWYFSRRYHDCNPTVFQGEDEVHTLTCALLLLNTDLHGQNVNKRMSCNDFIDNISQTGFKYPKSLLKSVYHSIKRSPIAWAKDSAECGKEKVPMNLKPVGLVDRESQIVYKKGWVMRKCLVEDNGKNTPFGRRSWRMFYATLKGMILYLHQDENGFKKGSFLTFRNSIRLHHAFAFKATDYMKKQSVFRLQTATSAEYLFQASDPKEMSEWIDQINFVAARFSTPCLPSAIGSRDSSTSLSTSRSSLRRRPSTLPASRTKYSLKDQLKNHEFRVEELQRQLDENHKYLPNRNAKSKVLQIYAENEIFLLLELQRYSTYVSLLQNVSSSGQVETVPTITNGKPQNLSEVVEEASNEDLRFENNEDDDSNNLLSDDKFSDTAVVVKGKIPKCNNIDRHSYKNAISECMNLKEMYETNF